jgi:hypothetical protein
MTDAVTLLDALDDEHLFRPCFTPGLSWRAWRGFLAATFALPMAEDVAAVYRVHTGRQACPTTPAREAWVVAGRRSGKSRMAALIAVYMATFRDYRAQLAPGERGTVMVIAADRKQARVVLRYIVGLFEQVELLRPLVERRVAEAIHLVNRVTIEVHTASFRAIRGYTLIAAVCDEVAYWRSEESANPDVEILNGLRPGLATVPGSLLLCISSPYARKGELWRTYKGHYGREADPVLVWQADTRAMNPSVDGRVIRAAYEADEVAARSEYGAEFRVDIESFITKEALEACVVPGRRELAPVPGLRYVAFVDPSGGSQDAMTVAVAHRDGEGRVVVDAVRERRAPFSPDGVVADFAEVVRAYGVSTVEGDRYAGEWPREGFRRHGVAYTVAEKSKSELYVGLLPLVNSGMVEVLDHPRLLAQLANLERRTRAGGRDAIDHPPLGHDDLANAVAGAVVAAGRSASAVDDETAAAQIAGMAVGVRASSGWALGGSALDAPWNRWRVDTYRPDRGWRPT